MTLSLTLFAIWAAILGACLGSFYGACIYRYAHEMNLSGRSFCQSCGVTLPARHLVPVFSWLFLRGRCAFCGAPIGLACLVTECLSALLAFLLAIHYGPTLAFAVMLVVFGALFVASGIDLKCYILPDFITFPLAAAALPIAVLVLGLNWLSSLAGGFCGAGLLLLLRLFFKKRRGIEALGLGDVKLMLSLGFLCGIVKLPLLLLTAALTALAASTWWLLRRPPGASLRETTMPFGPFLSLAGFVVLLYGAKIEIFFHFAGKIF